MNCSYQNKNERTTKRGRNHIHGKREIVLLGAWIAICHPIYFKIRLTDIWIFVGGAGAVFYALYSVFSKIGMKKDYPALTITFYSMVAIAVVLLPFTQWGRIAHYITVNPVRNTLFMLMHSLCTAVCPYAFYTVALDHMEAGKASILCSCEPVAAMVFGVFFFREIPTVLSITGLVIVLTALAIFVLLGKKPKDAEEYDHVKR